MRLQRIAGALIWTGCALAVAGLLRDVLSSAFRHELDMALVDVKYSLDDMARSARAATKPAAVPK